MLYQRGTTGLCRAWMASVFFAVKHYKALMVLRNSSAPATFE